MAILEEFKTEFGLIRVTRSKRDGSLAYFQNGCFHSQTNKAGISVCSYVHAIFEVLRQAKARDVLMIGCAGGSLATMLTELNCRVTVVDINPTAFTIAKRYFHLPEDVKCVVKDGIAFLRANTKKFDAIVVDVFGSNNQVPQPFTTRSFFQSVLQNKKPYGLMVMNVITAHDGDERADEIARSAENAGMQIDVIDWPRESNRNTLLVSGMTRKMRIPSGLEPEWMKDDMVGAVRRLPRRRIRAA